MLGRKIRDLAATLGVGMAPKGEAREGLLSGGAVEDVYLPLAAGSCFAVAAASDRAIDLALFDERNRLVDHEDPDATEVVLRGCAPRGGTYRVRVHVEEGRGRFALQVFEAAPASN